MMNMVIGRKFWGHFYAIFLTLQLGCFAAHFFRGQGGLLTELKNQAFLGVEKEPKNALKNALKME